MMWAQVALSALLAISLYRHTAALALCAVAYACAYHAWYRRLAGPIADTSIPA